MLTYCPNGHPLMGTARFCPECGSACKESICSNCGTETDPQDIHCGACGTLITTEVSTTTKGQMPSPEPGTVTSAASPRRSREFKIKSILLSKRAYALGIGGIAVLAVLLMALTGTLSGGGPTMQNVAVIVNAYEPCQSAQQSAGLFQGTPITVKGDKGTQIGSGSLGSGSSTTPPQTGGGFGRGCIFSGNVRLPTNQSTYTVSVGSGGGVAFSRDQLRKNGWNASIAYGCNGAYVGC